VLESSLRPAAPQLRVQHADGSGFPRRGLRVVRAAGALPARLLLEHAVHASALEPVPPGALRGVAGRPARVHAHPLLLRHASSPGVRRFRSRLRLDREAGTARVRGHAGARRLEAAGRAQRLTNTQNAVMIARIIPPTPPAAPNRSTNAQ